MLLLIVCLWLVWFEWQQQRYYCRQNGGGDPKQHKSKSAPCRLPPLSPLSKHKCTVWNTHTYKKISSNDRWNTRCNNCCRQRSKEGGHTKSFSQNHSALTHTLHLLHTQSCFPGKIHHLLILQRKKISTQRFLFICIGKSLSQYSTHKSNISASNDFTMF